MKRIDSDSTLALRAVGFKSSTRAQASAVLGFLGCALSLVAAAEPAFRTPEGFSVLRVAAPPMVVFPMFAAWDDTGGLFVAESSGLDLYEELRQQTRRCRVSRLSACDGRGRFQQARVFAEQLVFPMGLVWREGKLYVADPPDLVTLTDTNLDGRADQRTVLLTGFGHSDNGSLHGLIFGPDGWLYMTMGQPDGYRLERPDGTILSGKSGALLRCRPDGSQVEVVCRGFENLVEIEFLPSGEMIGTDNWFSRPQAGERDALVHLIEDGLYPLQLRDRGTTFLVSGDPLPPMRMYPAVALSGMVRYRSRVFPQTFHGSLFSAQFNARKVVAHRLTRFGSTFQTQDADFLTTDDPDFHPSDVLEDAEGNLLIVDTGAWYVHHCPTGRIRPAPAQGGIYQVRFDHAEPQVRRPRESRIETRLEWEGHLARAAFRSNLIELAAADLDQAAYIARALGRTGDPRAEKGLMALLAHRAMPARLAAAEALAHCGSSNALPVLLSALAGETDRFLEHALIRALHRLADLPTLEAALNHAHPRVQKAALILLDQPPRQTLAGNAVLDRLFAQDPELRRAALRILQGHSDWAARALPAIRTSLEKPMPEAGTTEAIGELILAFQNDRPVQQLLGESLTNHQLVLAQRLSLVEILGRTSVAPWPESWTTALDIVLRQAEPTMRLQAARTARRQQIATLQDTLSLLINQTNLAPELRLEAMRATVARQPQLTPAAFELVLARVSPPSGPGARLAAAELLGRSRWADARKDPQRLVAVVREDPLISPATLLPLLARAEGAQAATAVWAYLFQAADRGWRPEAKDLALLRARVSALGEKPFQDLSAVLERRVDSLRNQIHSYLELLAGGDPARGQQWFANKVGCSACHRVGLEGGLAGPDLTKIGAIRSGPDLVESVVAPSATFAQSYETFAVALRDGEEMTGIRIGQAEESFVLRDATGAEVRLDPDQIQNVRRSPVSLMPEGLLTGLTREEIRDLFAYLQSLR